jgi:hypothetical protein
VPEEKNAALLEGAARKVISVVVGKPNSVVKRLARHLNFNSIPLDFLGGVSEETIRGPG